MTVLEQFMGFMIVVVTGLRGLHTNLSYLPYLVATTPKRSILKIWKSPKPAVPLHQQNKVRVSFSYVINWF